MAFVGQYHGGFTTLIINEDKSTCWDTGTEHLPAEMEDLGNGVWHIHSADSVADEDKVDVYTDGTMAYVVHDAVEQDIFICDKGAEYEAANAMAKKADNSLLLGSVVVNSKPKFFRKSGNSYEFNVRVQLNYGASIEAEGAIFDIIVGQSSATYRTATAGNSAAGLAAIIEDYQISMVTYHGDAGDLVVAKNNDQLVFVTLDGVDMDPELVEEDADGNIIIKSGQRTLDNSDPSHIVWVYAANKYTLDAAAHTYAVSDATSTADVFQQLDLTQNSISCEVGPDGNLWAMFSPAVGGFFSIEETQSTSSDGYLAIYDAAATSYIPSNYLAYSDVYSGLESIEDFEVEAGKTYVVKAGAYADRNKTLGDTGSTYEGNVEALSYSYNAFDIVTYNGDQGALVLESFNGTFLNATLNGQSIGDVTKTGNVLTGVATAYDFSDPTNPVKTTTTVTITINPDDLTYVYATNSESEAVFHVLTEADSGTIYSGTVGDDGNLWAIFTPAATGYLTVEETTSTSSDGLIAVYEASAPAFTSGYGADYSYAKADTGAALSGAGKITNLLLTGGNSYIIKAGNYYDGSKDIGGTGSQYAGLTEAFSFEFSSLLNQTFTGDDGDLVVSTEDGELRGATLAGVALGNIELVDNGDGSWTLSSMGEGTIDNSNPLDPIRTSTDVVFTIDVAGGTYTSQSAQNVRHVFKEVTTTPATISGNVEADGNLWLKFTPAVDGYLTIEEIVSTSSDGYLALYDSSAAAFTSANALVKADYGAAFSGAGKITKYLLTGGTTYIIKGGNYYDKDKVVGDTGSTKAGALESISVIFDAFDVKTYSGASGDLVITKAGSELVSVTLGGAAVEGAFDNDGNFYTSAAAVVDNSDPLNPVMSSTDTIYVLDSAANTYTIDTQARTRNIFHEVTASAEVSDTVGGDGNLWIKFTAPSDGEITVEELVSTTSDGYIAVYKSTAASFKSASALAKADSGAALSGAGKISNLKVDAGTTYIIKAGNYYDRDKLVTDTNSTNKGKAETVSFIFQAYSADVYAPASGEGENITINRKGEEILSILLGETALEGYKLENGVLTIDNGVSENEGVFSSSKTVYTLDAEGNTYSVETIVTPLASSNNYVLVPSVGNYGFDYDEEQNSYTSNNGGVNSSNAIMTFTAGEDGVLSFDYDVSSEGTSTLWDYLKVEINGQAAEGLAAKLGGSSGAIGHYAVALHEGDVVRFTYYKDSSGNGGKDRAVISNILFLAPAAEGGDPEPQPQPAAALPLIAEGTKIEGAGAWIYLDNSVLGITGENAAALAEAATVTIEASYDGENEAALGFINAGNPAVNTKQFDEITENKVRFYVTMDRGSDSSWGVEIILNISIVIGDNTYSGDVRFVGWTYTPANAD